MNMILVPSFNFISGKTEPYVPYGLLCLQAIAVDFPEYSVDIAFPSDRFLTAKFSSSEEVVESVLADLNVLDYDVFGFSTVCNSLHYTVSIARRIKKIKPSAVIIFGGPFVTKLSAKVLEAFEFVDAVFVGESEITFRNFLKQRQLKSKPFFGIPGIHSRVSPFVSGSIIDNLDELPYITEAPDYFKWLNLEKLLIPDKSFAPVEATRGCPLKCSFCSTKQVWGAKVRRKSAHRLVEEMRAIETISSDSFFSLTGDNVGVPRIQFMRFCEDLVQISNKYTWACSLKLDRFSERELILMWEAGCRGMFVGIESASQVTLNRVNKAASVENEVKNIRLAIELGFQIETSFIIGFPWETEKDLKDTYELHCEFLRLGAKRSQVGVLSPIPGTEIVADGNVVFDGSQPYFADDGIHLSLEHREMISCFPDLFTHFGRYETQNLSPITTKSYQNAAAQVSGLFLSRRHTLKQAIPFSGRSAATI